MNLLSTLPYISFDDFFIRVKRIRYGWMELYIGFDDNNFNYSASYLSDPLADLLEVTVYSIIEKQSSISDRHYDRFCSINNYYFVVHDLEGDNVFWLFKYADEELTIIIWNETFDEDVFFELAQENFNSESMVVKMQDPVIDINKGVLFAMKGAPIGFIKALNNTLGSLKELDRPNEHADDYYNDWGFIYSSELYEKLNDWLQKNEIVVNPPNL